MSGNCFSVFVSGPSGDDKQSIVNQFLRSNGKLVFEQLMVSSGFILGHWKLDIVSVESKGENQPLLSHFVAGTNKVQYKFAPAGKQCFVVAVQVFKEHKYTATQLRNGLMEAAAVLYEQNKRNPVTKTKRELGDGTIELLFLAIDQLSKVNMTFSTIDDFTSAVAKEVGPEEDTEFWENTLKWAEKNGLVKQEGNTYKKVESTSTRTKESRGGFDVADVLAEQGDTLATTLIVLSDLGKKRKAAVGKARKEVDTEIQIVRKGLDVSLLSQVLSAMQSM